MKDGVTCFKVGDLAKGNSGRLHCRRGGRHPARAFVKKALRISIRKGDWSNAGARQFQEDRMIAQDLKHGGVWKSLLVIAEQLGNIDASENCGLARSALRPAFNSEPRVGRYHNAIKDCRVRVCGRESTVRHCCRWLVRKNRQRLRVSQAIEWILCPARSDPETVDEEKQN